MFTINKAFVALILLAAVAFAGYTDTNKCDLLHDTQNIDIKPRAE